MLAQELAAANFEGEFDLDGVPAEVQELAAKLYVGLHPALRSLGISYASREHAAQRDAIRRVVALTHIIGDTQSVDAALDAMFA